MKSNSLIIMILFCLILSTLSFSNNQMNILIANNYDDVVIEDGEYKVIKKNNIIEDFAFKDKLKIYYVGSYGPGHICGQPQINSFFRCIKNIDINHNIIVDIEGWYLDTVMRFTTRTQINDISKHVIKDIKRYDPDIIYVTDDAAFEHIGITLSKNYPIFFSGINNSYESYNFRYKSLINDNNMVGVDEIIDIEKLYHLFRMSKVFPDKWYFINDNTDMSKYIFNNISIELDKLGVKYELYNVDNTVDYITLIKKLNNNNPGLIVNNVHSLWSKDHKTHLDTRSLTMLLVKYNITHLDFSINKELCKYGLSISIGPDYNKKGYLVGQLFSDVLNSKKISHKVLRLNSEITINYRRIEELPYYKCLLNNLNEIDNIISSY